MALSGQKSYICGLLLLVISSACVQKRHTKNITFKVDMTAVEKFDQVWIKGSFTSPPWQTNLPLQDENKDGIYEIKLTYNTAKSSIEFKYGVDQDQFELQGQNNRVLILNYQPERIANFAIFDQLEGKQILLPE